MDLLQQGLYFRGEREFDRRNFGKAYEAFKSAGNYRNSLFQMAEIIRHSSQAVEETVEHYWSAYEAGDRAALPWLCELEEGVAFESKVENPRLKEIQTALEDLRQAHDPIIIRELSRLFFQVGELAEGLRYLKAAVLLGDPESRLLLSDLLTNGPTSPGFHELYKLMLNKDIFDFSSFPFEPELLPLSRFEQDVSSDQEEISDELSKLLYWLYDQGDTELRTSGLLMRRLLLEMHTAESYDVFIEYHNQFKNTFGYRGSISSDISFIFDIAANLTGVSKKPDLSVYEYLAERYGVRDLFDEVVNETLSAKAKEPYYGKYYNINAFSYNSNFSLESAKKQIPIDYELPSVKSFVICLDNLDFESAEELFTKVLSDAKSGSVNAALEVANILELIDRLRFEFDVLPGQIVKFVLESVELAISEDKTEILSRALVEFRPNGERPYFMDNFDLKYLGQAI